MDSTSFGRYLPPSFAEPDLASLVVRPIRPEEKAEWDHLMATHHYLGFRTLVGESLKYVALLQDQWVALLGWGTAAFKCGPRDRWIGWSPELHMRRLKYVANNQRFLILPGVFIKNLASKILALNVRRLAADWQAVFGHPLFLAETFVDPARFAGTCYRAAGWSLLGQTRGYGYLAGKYYFHGVPKTVWIRPLHPQTQRILADPFDSPILQGGSQTVSTFVVNWNNAPLDGREGLRNLLAQLPDLRKRRGIRHNLVSILLVAIAAVLSGARNYVTIGEWAAQLSQEALKRLGCRYHEETKRYIPPSEPTLRRVLQSINIEAVEAVLGQWLAASCDSDAIAVDGKTLRGTRAKGGKPVHLLSALVHKEGVVIAQRAVDAKSNEITAFKPLLEPLDLQGKVITADAMHTQIEHARWLQEEKNAEYVFTVKGNQEGIKQAIEALEERDFSPSVSGD